MLQVSTEVIDNKTFFQFTSRGTSYTINKSSVYDGCYDVFSKRGGCSHYPQSQVLNEREMRQRAKILGTFLDLIQTEESTTH